MSLGAGWCRCSSPGQRRFQGTIFAIRRSDRWPRRCGHSSIRFARKSANQVAEGGIIGPARLPREGVQRLHTEIKAALAVPSVVERYRALDSEIAGGTPEEFLAL